MKYRILSITMSFFLLLYGVYSCSPPTTSLSEDQDKSELKYGGEPRPIVSSDYERFLLVKTTSIDYCKSSIVEYCELNILEEAKDTATSYKTYALKICQRGLWVMVKFPKDFPFYDYHNLVGWIWGYGSSPDLPSDALGFSIHKKVSDKSYYVELDRTDKYGDVVVGSDQLGNSVYSYLPDAYLEGGNLRVTSEIEYSYANALSKISSARIDLNFYNFNWNDFDVKLFF